MTKTAEVESRLTESYFTPTDISDRFKIPVSTLAQWRSRNVGPKPTRMPGSRLVRYSASDVNAWLESENA